MTAICRLLYLLFDVLELLLQLLNVIQMNVIDIRVCWIDCRINGCCLNCIVHCNAHSQFIDSNCRFAVILIIMRNSNLNNKHICNIVRNDNLSKQVSIRNTFSITPDPPEQTDSGTISSIDVRHCTHFFIILEQLSQATIWPHGLKNTDARLSEHTKHSSIFSRDDTVSRHIKHFFTRGAHVSQQLTCPHGWNTTQKETNSITIKVWSTMQYIAS